MQNLWSLALDDLAGPDAASADAHPFACTAHLRLDGLQIDVPTTAGRVVGVRDIVSELRAFAAEITFGCHDVLLQSRLAEVLQSSSLIEK